MRRSFSIEPYSCLSLTMEIEAINFADDSKRLYLCR